MIISSPSWECQAPCKGEKSMKQIRIVQVVNSLTLDKKAGKRWHEHCRSVTTSDEHGYWSFPLWYTVRFDKWVYRLNPYKLKCFEINEDFKVNNCKYLCNSAVNLRIIVVTQDYMKCPLILPIGHKHNYWFTFIYIQGVGKVLKRIGNFFLKRDFVT